MTVRFRQEVTPATVKSFPIGTTVIVAANTVLAPNTRIGIYRAYLNAGATAATFQFQDTAGNALSAVYSLPVNGFFPFETPTNLEPLWLSGASPGNAGIQLVVTGATVTGDVWYQYMP